MRGIIVFLSLLALSLAWSFPVKAQSGKNLAVLDLKPRGLDKAVAENITGLVVKEVDRLGLFKIISMDDIRRILEHEQSKRLAGCDDVQCLAEIGGALGVELLIAGGVGKLGETYVVSLKLIDVRSIKVMSREERTVSGRVEDLVTASRQAARTLLRPIMAKASGMLELSCSEEGAEVYIDEVMVGTTPIKPRRIPGGYHAVKVVKKRFVVHGRDVKIEPGKTATVEVQLLPSAAFIKEYESRASTYRTLAWVFSGVAVAAAGSATGLFFWNDGRLDDYNRDKQDPGQDLNDLNNRADSINMVDSVTLGVGICAAAALGTALYFWLAGDTPGRYEDVGEKPSSASVDISGGVAPGSGFATMVLRF